jgi:hypothetical protein
METAAQQAARLLIALTELVEREGTFLRAGYYDLATEARERAGPLVRQLTCLAGQPGLEAFVPKVAALQASNDEHDAFLCGKFAELAAELRRIDETRHRVAQMAPVYAPGTGRAGMHWQAAV